MVDMIIPILIGWALGYTVNYFGDVLPDTRRFTHPVCQKCGNALPLLDYLTGQRCRKCGHPRFFRLWGIILVMAIASVYIWREPPNKLGYVLGLVLITYFATVFIIDLEHRLILHPTSIVGGLLGLSAGWLSHGLIPTLIGGLAGLGIMLILYYFGVLFSRLRARRLRTFGAAADDEEALGAGDVILAGILGLALGWPLIWFGLLLGILLGGLYGLILVIAMNITRKYQGKALMVFMPYGPFFILSAFFIIYLPNLVLHVVPK